MKVIAGEHEYNVKVAYHAQFPRNTKGLCAFCNGDPCNEQNSPGRGSEHIRLFYERNPKAETCPVCDGQPS